MPGRYVTKSICLRKVTEALMGRAFLVEDWCHSLDNILENCAAILVKRRLKLVKTTPTAGRYDVVFPPKTDHPHSPIFQSYRLRMCASSLLET